MAHQTFPEALVAFGRSIAIGTNAVERWLTFHGNLTTFDIQGNVVPQVAQKVPSIQDGDWAVSPDGTMEVTWKLRPGAVWHDGAPLTAADFAFGYEVVMDPKHSVPELGEVTNMSSVRAVDDQTLVISWKIVSVRGGHNGVVGVPPLPRHLLGDLYRTGDTLAFEASPIWGSQWVGLGPYKVVAWEGGSHIEGQAFDQYALGRPKIDRLVIRFIGDVNVLVANLLAGAIDLAPLGVQLKPEQIVELQRTWGDKGEAYASPNAMRVVHLQYRDPSAPWVQDLRFRQAMIHSLNRVEFVEALMFGQTEFGHYLAMPDDPVTRLAEQRGVIQYPYDPARAERLFADAGWTRGADRLLRNSAGQTVHFVCCREFDDDSNDIRESLAVVSELQKAGMQAEHPIPSPPSGVSTTEQRRFAALNRNGNIGPFRFNERGSLASLISTQIATDENRWTGSNSGGWSNPTYDGVYADMMRTFDLGPRQELEFQLIKLAAEQLPVLPMYYSPVGVAVRKGVEGINRKPHAPPLTQNTTWNIHTWDLK
jgi:peptide/nickel transport system substrate-binding protein